MKWEPSCYIGVFLSCRGNGQRLSRLQGHLDCSWGEELTWRRERFTFWRWCGEKGDNCWSRSKENLSICLLLQRNGTILCQIIESRCCYSFDLQQGGLKVPYTLTFQGNTNDIQIAFLAILQNKRCYWYIVVLVVVGCVWKMFGALFSVRRVWKVGSMSRSSSPIFISNTELEDSYEQSPRHGLVYICSLFCQFWHKMHSLFYRVTHMAFLPVLEY